MINPEVDVKLFDAITAAEAEDATFVEVVVTEFPDCDGHLQYHGGQRVPAAYDAETSLPGNPWGFLCEGCFVELGTGRGLGMGRGQRLVLASGVAS